MENKRTISSSVGQILNHKPLITSFDPKITLKCFQQRVELFKKWKQQQKDLLKTLPQQPIQITLKDGSKIKGLAYKTTPLQIAKGISKQLADKMIAAKIIYSKKIESPFSKSCISAQVQEQQSDIKGQIYDLSRPLQGDCTLQLIGFDNPLGKQVFWHSSSHILGQALQQLYGALLTHGPALKQGFFYDGYTGKLHLNQSQYPKIQKLIQQIIKQNQPFQRLILTKKQALQLFSYNPFKVSLIQNKVPQGAFTSAYRCGNLVDLCMGPHLPQTGRVKGFKVIKNSSSNWLGKTDLDSLQRVYGISFPTNKQLTDYQKLQAMLLQKDHRNIGMKQDLFHFNQLSPGSAFFFPHGTIIYNKLLNFIRKQYLLRGYQQVISPNLYNSKLWKISGHYFKYKQNMFFVQNEDGQYGLKPMNCPGHCLMFDMTQHSYRDLPIRYADFGVLHRNEIHGALSGLTRVRRFQQDDSHIFCLPQQIQDQILAVLQFLQYVYSVFGFKYNIQLSTRPQHYLGKLEVWDQAQTQLMNALKRFGKQYKINPGDGAFYGPKIDIKLFDVFNRQHQCGTIQLDFQLPIRFDLQFRTKQVQHLTQQQKKLQQQQRLKKKKQKKQKGKKKKQGKQGDQDQVVQQVHDMIQQHSMLSHQHVNQQQLYSIQKPIKKGFSRPVIIHRAIFGSVQRMMAILCQMTGGKWPFWISPRQVIIVPVNMTKHIDYAMTIHNTLTLKGYCSKIDDSGQTFNKKILLGQQSNYNYVAVVGDQQMKENKIDLRDRDKSDRIGKFTIGQLIKLFQSLQPPISKKQQQLYQKSMKI